MVTGKLGQQVLPGLLLPAWLQGSRQRESPLAAGQEELPLPTACCRQEERRRASKTLPQRFPKHAELGLAGHVDGFTAHPLLALKGSALTEKLSPPHLHQLRTRARLASSRLCLRSSSLLAAEQDQTSTPCPGASCSLSG